MAAPINVQVDQVQGFIPDGRQTRIEFSSDQKQAKRQSFEWWHALTGWLKSSDNEKEHQLESFNKYLEGKNYREKTRRSYLFMLKKFLDHLDKKQLQAITYETIEDYNYEFFVSGKYSRSYQLQFISALSLYLEYKEGTKVNLKSLRPTNTSR